MTNNKNGKDFSRRNPWQWKLKVLKKKSASWLDSDLIRGHATGARKNDEGLILLYFQQLVKKLVLARFFWTKVTRQVIWRVMQTESTRAFIGGYCFKLFGDTGKVVNLFLKYIYRIETVDRSHQVNAE